MNVNILKREQNIAQKEFSSDSYMGITDVSEVTCQILNKRSETGIPEGTMAQKISKTENRGQIPVACKCSLLKQKFSL